jgi:DNA-directed RNA polymerase alpha subunit
MTERNYSQNQLRLPMTEKLQPKSAKVTYDREKLQPKSAKVTYDRVKLQPKSAKVTYDREKLHYIGTINFKHRYVSNKPCESSSTDYWANDTIGN